MMNKIFAAFTVCCTLALASNLAAQERLVVGGQTSVLLDTNTLTAAGLTISGVSPNVIAPGELGGDSVAFGINSRSGNLPTTFSYTVGSLAPFSGTIEHAGSVFFNNDTIEVGNFTIGFDGNRTAGNNSGFFVQSTVGVQGILFDVGNPDSLNAGNDILSIGGALFVSPEFAGILGNAGFTGANGGNFLINATSIPEPSAGLVLLVGAVGLMIRRRC